MTMPPDKSEQDPRLAAAWRGTSDELPPAPLDSAILAAAHLAVGSGSRDAEKPGAARRDARRWRIPLAAAASICVVALGVLLTRPEQPAVSTMSVSAPPSVPTPASAPVMEQAPARRDAAAPAPASAPPPGSVAASEKSAPTAKKRSNDLRELAAAPAAQEAAPPPAVADKAELFKQSESRAAASLSGNLADQDAARGAPSAAAPVDAAAAIAHIRQLHRQGKLAQAAEELRALRAATPAADQQLPVELRAWAATIKP